MGAGQGSRDDLQRILRLKPDSDPTSLQLSAQEGFLLSRIDGHTPWRLLREIGGMDCDEADLCLEGWLANGLVVVAGLAPPPSRESRRQGTAPARRPSPAAASGGPAGIDESQLDPSLEIDIEVQRRVLDFEAGLERPYHELLGVDRDADARQIKRAYFALSKEFHPDRYFRRQIGGYVERLERIFKKVLEAHEILSDPQLREELVGSRAQPAASPKTEEPRGEADRSESDEVQVEPRPLSKLERLRQRMPFKIPEHIVSERRTKAAEFYQASQRSELREQYGEAVSSLRIAICFDPYNAEYKSALGELQAKAAEAKARRVLRRLQTDDSMDSTELKEAFELLEGLILYRPHDPDLNRQAARLALELDRVEKAFEYARAAVDHSPQVAAHHTTLGLVYRAKGNIGYAKNEFASALELDSGDSEACKAMASLSLGGRAAARGGRHG